MTKSIVATSAAPSAIGPYNQAVIHNGLVYCSGQIAIDPRTSELVERDITAQSERVMKNLEAVLREAGTGFEHALKCTCYLATMADFAAFNEVYGRYFSPDTAPARATVAAAGLPKDVLVEVDCVAALP